MAVAPPTARRIHVAVVADAHLGSARARARELGDYLDGIAPCTLVVAGDLLDLAALKTKRVPDEHLGVVRRLLDLAAAGTRVYVLTGNHDAALGRFGDLALGNLHLRRELELHLDGRRYLFCHGDRLEKRAGSWVERQWGRVLAAAGQPRRSLARELRGGGDAARAMLHQYQLAAARLARARRCDTVVCAHVQQPAMADVELPGVSGAVRYLNPGDWVSNCSALEYRWGEWRLRYYDADDLPPRSPRLRPPSPERERRETRSLLEQIVSGGPTRK